MAGLQRLAHLIELGLADQQGKAAFDPGAEDRSGRPTLHQQCRNQDVGIEGDTHALCVSRGVGSTHVLHRIIDQRLQFFGVGFGIVGFDVEKPARRSQTPSAKQTSATTAEKTSAQREMHDYFNKLLDLAVKPSHNTESEHIGRQIKRFYNVALRYTLTPSKGPLMYRGYKLDLDNLKTDDYIAIGDCIDIGRKIYENQKEQVKQKLDSFKNSSDNLVASAIISGWFPPIQANVFLSHSHKDETMVFGLSGFLYLQFGITSFVDSSIWGHSDDLLRLLDDAYCYKASTNTYSYSMRNRSTSHVHIMLSIALMKMIDSCECIMFVDTPNSISPKEYINSGDETDSPWIYSEISMSNLVRRRSLLEHRGSFAKAGRTMDSRTESIHIQYDVNLGHLIPLTRTQFAKWKRCGETKTKALDALYNLEAEE